MDALESIRRDNPQNLNGTASVEDTAPTWNDSEANASKLLDLPQFFTTVASVPEFHHPYPTVDVPDHAHYVIGSVILTVGITGMVGNLLVMYAFSRSRSLRTPANMFIINLAVTDFLMCLSQSPMFFITSMHKRWIFGEKGCELYAFTGALFGICSMITLMVISLDRYFVITRPLTSIGGISRKRAALILAATWLYAMGWSLPPFFGWSAYVPEGLLTSCTWDYMTFSPSVRAYTMLLFLCVFFIPLLIIIYSYIFIFRAVRGTNMAVDKMTGDNSQDEIKKRRRMKSELKMAKIAFIVVLLYVISWSPYASVALTAFAGYADLLTPYVNSVPAVIAKASAIHNPIIYAITHPKYRSAIAKYIPFLGVLLCVPEKEQTSTSSFNSTRRFTVMSQTSDNPNQQSRKRRTSSVSDTDSVLTDTEADFPSIGSPAGPHVSNDVQDPQSRKPSSSFKSKTKGSELSISEKALTDTQGIAMVELGQFPPAVAGEEAGQKGGQIPSIVITTESTPGVLQPQKSSGQGSGPKTVNGEFGARPGPVDGTGIQQGPQIPFIGPKNST